MLSWQDWLNFFFPLIEKCSFCEQNKLSKQEIICSSCRAKIEFLTVEKNWQQAALAFYQGIWQEIIQKWKYTGQVHLTKTLGKMLAQFCQQEKITSHYLLPIPLHKNKIRKRGFNQTFLLAQALNSEIGMPILTQALIRQKDTLSQVSLSKKERKKNMLDAFLVIKQQKIAGKNIILLDDVYTTGATAQSAQKVLLLAGAKSVKILTLARGKFTTKENKINSGKGEERWS